MPSPYQFQGGDQVSFPFGGIHSLDPSDADPLTLCWVNATGTPDSPGNRFNIGNWEDYDLASIPDGAMGLLPGDKFRDDLVAWTMSGYNGSPAYDLAGWRADLNYQSSYTVEAPHPDGSGDPNFYDNAKSYILRHYEDSSSLLVTTPHGAHATACSVQVKRYLYVAKAPYHDAGGHRYVMINPVYGLRIDGYRFFIQQFVYQTSACPAPYYCSFFIAAHWAITNPSPLSLVQGDPSLLTVALTPPLNGVPYDAGVGNNHCGGFFVVDLERSAAPFTGPPFVPESFENGQEEVLETLSSSVDTPSLGLPAPELSGSGFYDRVIDHTYALGTYPPPPFTADYHVRLRVEYLTQRYATAGYGAAVYTPSGLIFDDGPQYLDVTVTARSGGGGGGSGPRHPKDAGDDQDMAQDGVTGRVTRAFSQVAVAGTSTTPAVNYLDAEAWEGWQNLSGTQPRPPATILDARGNPVQGQYPSLWKVSEEGRYSLCYQSQAGTIVRADSLDGLTTLMPFPTLLFHNGDGSPRTGGRPCHFQDHSTGIYYVAAAFDVLDSHGTPTGNEDVLIARVDSQGTILPWLDGTTQKAVVLGTPAAGRPVLVPNRYDPEQPILLRHGDRQFLGSLGGEQWEEIL